MFFYGHDEHRAEQRVVVDHRENDQRRTEPTYQPSNPSIVSIWSVGMKEAASDYIRTVCTSPSKL